MQIQYYSFNLKIETVIQIFHFNTVYITGDVVKWQQLGFLQYYYKSEFHNISFPFPQAFVNLHSFVVLSVGIACFPHKMISLTCEAKSFRLNC